MSISFYTGAKALLLSTPTNFTTNVVKMVACHASYTTTFNANHTITQVLNAAETDPAILTNKTYEIYGDGYVFDSNDVRLLDSTVEEIGCIVLYYDGGNPICMVSGSDIYGLPGFARGVGSSLDIVFSNSVDKIFSITSTTSTAGKAMASFGAPPPVYVTSTEVSREQSSSTSSRRLINSTLPTKSNIYIDVNCRGGAHPLTGDLTYTSNQYAINQSLRNILLTSKTERPFDNIDFGAGINSVLFDLGDPTTLLDLKLNIVNTITNFENRIILQNVNLRMNNLQNGLYIDIQYIIKDTNEAVSFNLFLERA